MIAADDEDDPLDDVIRLELEFLTALAWAPPEIVAAAVAAIVGPPDDRGGPDVIADPDAVFLHPGHAQVFAAIVTRVDDGLPVTPRLLVEGLAEPTMRTSLRAVLTEISAPTGRGPLPGGADVPYLASAVIDHWYRRGYRSLVSRMFLACDESPTDELADRWAELTDHQRAAHRRRTSVRRRLTRV